MKQILNIIILFVIGTVSFAQSVQADFSDSLSLGKETVSQYESSVSVELNSLGINRYLQEQYIKNDIPKYFSAEGIVIIEGISLHKKYELRLSLPKIILGQNIIKLQMGFLFEDVTANKKYEFEVTPSLKLKGGSYAFSDLRADLQDFENALNAVAPLLPKWIKDTINYKYSKLKVKISPDSILSRINSGWLGEKGIIIKDMQLSWDVKPDNIVAKVTTSYESKGFAMWLHRYTKEVNGVKKEYLAVTSYSKLKVIRLRWTDILTDLYKEANDLEMSLKYSTDPKNIYQYYETDGLEIDENYRNKQIAAKIYASNGVTYYVRYYEINTGDSWQPAKKIIN